MIPDDVDAYRVRKAALLGSLSGDVLEIGAGTGANFGYFRREVRWTGLEPNRRARATLREVARAHGHDTEVLDAPAERIPLPDASVSAVVATVVLCSVTDQDATLAEVIRVLRPGGRFVFFEHVAAPVGTWPRRLQRLSAPFSRVLDRGCDPARDTERAIRRAGFAEVTIERYAGLRWAGVPIPLIAGTGQV
ncbi:class I SAM-dependent methyltransferase [Labedaea rhizosphaerae]|uniref:Methyltransferase family protein n=1 Tax=Labedaea rhizosphaerae TaxID=598644 RepID=A0A4V3CZT9_LABRH|nr:class I SAM-dependent methyltransferase [Labedaea rhizosphaerae]TDQ01001.1 methyltransferase family protein [Labedaea rhizosphaerae]